MDPITIFQRLICVSARLRWLHLGLDLVSGEIICSDLTKDDVGDPTVLPVLLDQINSPVAKFIADGAYDGDPTSKLLTGCFGHDVEIIIPPPKTAVLSASADDSPTGRDQRSRAETQMSRWKIVIGSKLKARSFPNHRTEAKIGTHILNIMTGLGPAKFEKVA